MAAVARRSLVSQVVRLLPAAVLRALDGWSLAVARRRAARRQRKWLQQKAAHAAAK
jgi:hypothetical protein